MEDLPSPMGAPSPPPPHRLGSFISPSPFIPSSSHLFHHLTTRHNHLPNTNPSSLALLADRSIHHHPPNPHPAKIAPDPLVFAPHRPTAAVSVDLVLAPPPPTRIFLYLLLGAISLTGNLLLPPPASSSPMAPVLRPPPEPPPQFKEEDHEGPLSHLKLLSHRFDTPSAPSD